MEKLRILFAGESATIATTHIKGVDSFTHYAYSEGVRFIKPKLEEEGIEVTHMPCHDVMLKFPLTMEGLMKYDCVVLSDIGSNSLLFHPQVLRSEAKPNRLELIKEYVEEGGAFLMIGGYMTFAGVENKARYHDTPIEDMMPVTVLDHDDRVELPEGFNPLVRDEKHPITSGFPGKFPMMLFYNRVILKEGAQLLLSNSYRGRDDPILAVWRYGKGRSAAFTPDCAPHGASPEFLQWKRYGPFFAGMIRWLAGKS
jgi:uncharacterized membrane protein